MSTKPRFTVASVALLMLGGVLGQLFLSVRPLAAVQNQTPPSTAQVPIGGAVIPTGPASIAAGLSGVVVFSDFVRYVTVQNLSASDLELQTTANSTSRTTCDVVCKAGVTLTITAWTDRISIKNIGAGTVTLAGASRDVLPSGWR